MGEIVLVRHGQANSHARNDAEYDRLSDLGRRQAAWLGEWMDAHEAPFDQVICGGLSRQRETAELMGHTPDIDTRFDEMAYFTLGQALHTTHGIPMPEADGFAEHAPKVMRAWADAQIKGDETFASFEGRVTAAITEAAAEGRRVLAVTSGGVIAMAVRHVLGLDIPRLVDVMLPIRNSSVHRLYVRGDAMRLATFNATPHLDAPDRVEARTYY